MSRAEVSGVVNLCKAPEEREVLDPDENDCPKASISASIVSDSQCPECERKPPGSFDQGKLQVIGPKEEVVVPTYDAAVRPRSAAGRQGSTGRKISIPTKQTSLCTVNPMAHSSNIPDCSIPPSMETNKPEISTMQKIPSEPEDIIQTDEKETAGPQSLTVQNGNSKEHLEESSDEDESDDETSRAPLQLLAEFVNAVMDEDYQVAQKLSQMILVYEPENPDAKEFALLIEEMLQIEQESSEDEDSEDSDEETDEETDEDTSDTDDKNHCTAKPIS